MDKYVLVNLAIIRINICLTSLTNMDTNYIYFVVGMGSYINLKLSTNENQFTNHLSSELDLGCSGDVAVRLCSEIAHNINSKLYFDNFYSLISFMKYFAEIEFRF